MMISCQGSERLVPFHAINFLESALSGIIQHESPSKDVNMEKFSSGCLFKPVKDFFHR